MHLNFALSIIQQKFGETLCATGGVLGALIDSPVV